FLFSFCSVCFLLVAANGVGSRASPPQTPSRLPELDSERKQSQSNGNQIDAILRPSQPGTLSSHSVRLPSILIGHRISSQLSQFLLPYPEGLDKGKKEQVLTVL